MAVAAGIVASAGTVAVAGPMAKKVALTDKVAAVGHPAAGQKADLKLSVTVPVGDKLTAFTLNFGDHSKVVEGKKLPTSTSHVYGKAGRHTVTLTVTDKHRKSARATAKITIVAPPAKGGAGTGTTTPPTPSPGPSPTSAPAPLPTSPPTPLPTPSPSLTTSTVSDPVVVADGVDGLSGRVTCSSADSGDTPVRTVTIRYGGSLPSVTGDYDAYFTTQGGFPADDGYTHFTLSPGESFQVVAAPEGTSVSGYVEDVDDPSLAVSYSGELDCGSLLSFSPDDGLEVVVTDASGDPLSGVPVELNSPDFGPEPASQTDSAGRVDIWFGADPRTFDLIVNSPADSGYDDRFQTLEGTVTKGFGNQQVTVTLAPVGV